MLRLGSLCGAALFLVATSASAQAVRPNAGFMANDLGPTDDGSTAAVPLGFEVTYFGANYTSVYINNNGYMAFDEEVSTLFTATKLDQRLLAVFFADVDTRPDAGTGTMHYGTDTVDGRPAFGATWPGVGYYERHVDHLDTFQAIIIDRTDTGAGHFDVEFNFGTVSWECGDRSEGGVDGIGGRPSAIVGYSDGVHPSFLAGSGVPGSFLDSNLATGLIHGQSQSGVLGRYVFEFRQDPVAAADAPSDAGVPEAAVNETPPSNPSTPSVLGCACELSTVHADSGLNLALLTGGATLLLSRRRQSPRGRITGHVPTDFCNSRSADRRPHDAHTWRGSTRSTTRHTRATRNPGRFAWLVVGRGRARITAQPQGPREGINDALPENRQKEPSPQ